MTASTEDLSQQVQSVFSEHGVLAQQRPGYVPRQGQIEMALAVTQRIQQGGCLVVQAGTGVGKTFAYLVPALLSAERTVVSTATKALQEQLHDRDLPELLKALHLPLKTALLKGRASYLCLHRMHQTLSQGLLPDPASVNLLARVNRWSARTVRGDVSEVAGLEDNLGLMPLVTSSRDNCLGSDCEYWQDCHVNKARREAMSADVVVINHHLFFADWQVRESGVAELLPQVRVVVFDEAHQLNDIGIQFLGQNLSSSGLLDYARDVLLAGLAYAKGVADWDALTSQLRTSLKDLRLTLPTQPVAGRYGWTEALPHQCDEAMWLTAWSALESVLSALQSALELVAMQEPELSKLHERSGQWLSLLKLFSQPTQTDVRWVETSGSGQISLNQAPMEVKDALSDLWAEPEALEPRSESPAASSAVSHPPKAWIFTSATLGVDPQLSWFTQPCGLTHAHTLSVRSPFDYAKQSALFIPTDLVEPKMAQHTEQVAVLATRLARMLGGRTLVLTTTHRALKEIAQILTEDLDRPTDPLVRSQGQYAKRELMSWFQSQGQNPQERGAVLVATASFWEGFDVPGHALQAVIIDKLPFAPPNDPMLQARAQALEEQGKSAFTHLHLPDVAVALQQGAGRLIRTQTDLGVLVICDKRLATASYGKALIASLPAMRRVLTWQQLQAAMIEMNLIQMPEQG